MAKFLKKIAFSDDSKVKVIRDPLRFLWIRILLLATAVIAVVLSFYIGQYWSSIAASERDDLLVENEKLKKVLQIEKEQLAASLMDNKVTLLAVNKIREENITLMDRISSLEKDIVYYQRVMNPIRNDKGLRIDNVEIQNTLDTNRFRINAVLTQLGKENRTVIQGVLQMTISGSENGQKKTYNLDELKPEARDLKTNFRFRYYQEISEEVLLPENFVPEQILLEAIASGSKAMTIQREETWPIPEV